MRLETRKVSIHKFIGNMDNLNTRSGRITFLDSPAEQGKPFCWYMEFYDSWIFEWSYNTRVWGKKQTKTPLYMIYRNKLTIFT